MSGKSETATQRDYVDVSGLEVDQRCSMCAEPLEDGEAIGDDPCPHCGMRVTIPKKQETIDYSGSRSVRL